MHVVVSGVYSVIVYDVSFAISDTIRYNTIRWTILTCTQKHGTKQEKNNEQEGQHPLTGQRAANFRLSFLQ